MVRDRDPFSTALDDLRRRLTSGVYSGGAPVVILDEARRLKLSTTPVREALAWLSGAGLVEHVPAGGYRASRVEAGIIRDRYRFRRDCLSLSLGRFVGQSRPMTPFSCPEDIFDWIIGRGGDRALGEAYHRVAFHLERLRAAERQVVGDPLSAFEAMTQSLGDDRIDVLDDLILDYHQARISASIAIAFEADQTPLEPS